MAVLKSRTRLVTFRVSPGEYERLYGLCIASGARSISDFARDAVLGAAPTLAGGQTSLSGDLATLTVRLGELDRYLAEAREKIAKILGSNTQTDNAKG
jgi:hypothetical protein